MEKGVGMMPGDMGMLTGLLKQVSRSFYLTLRLLPGPVRSQIGLAYLLARATDTIADTSLIPVASRLAALDALRQRILGENTRALDFGELASGQGNPNEQKLLERIEEAISLLNGFNEVDKTLIREVLTIITSGQELDLKRFGDAAEGKVRALQTEEELDDYTYRVAGCVGTFWTRICCRHLFSKLHLDEGALLRTGEQYGKGLQLVNILRDLPSDLKSGRCYIPAKDLTRLNLAPENLCDSSHEGQLRPAYNRYLDLARRRLDEGWNYTNMLPYGHMRIRLACALPVLIGIKTLAKLKKGSILRPDLRIKVTRAELRWVAIRLLIWYPWPTMWRRLPEHRFFRAD